MPDPDPSPLQQVSDPVIVDLFAGPGGLDVAAHWLGIPSIGIEFDCNANETRGAAGFATISNDIREWRAAHFPKANVLTGGPPCQTFTVAGRGSGREDLKVLLKLIEMVGASDHDSVKENIAKLSDPRTELVLQPLRWALDAEAAGRPFQAIMLEQVPAVAPIWAAMSLVLQDKGYDVKVDVLKTEQYGVPQTRRRAILIARHGVSRDSVHMPDPTHQKYVRDRSASDGAEDGALRRWRTMADALPIDGPFTVVSNYGQGGDPGRRGERRSDSPAFTVTGKVSRNRLIYDDKRRKKPDRFTPEHAGLLQTFPSNYPWRGKDVSQQIGNAIPPRLGTHVLAALLGLDVTLDEAFFTERGHWSPPDATAFAKGRSATTRPVIAGPNPRAFSAAATELTDHLSDQLTAQDEPNCRGAPGPAGHRRGTID